MSWFLVGFFLIYGGFHGYLVWKLCAAFPALRGGWLVGLVLFCLTMMAAPYFVFRLGRSPDYPRLASVCSLICYTWTALLWWFVCLGVIGETWNLLARGTGHFWPAARQGIVPARTFLALALPLLLAALAWGLLEANNIRLRTVEIEVPQMAADAEPIRIAQITDLHLGMFMGRRRLERTLDCVREARADLIVATGDLTDSPAEEYPELVAMLAAVDAPLGKYAVTGNHEYFVGLEAAVAFHAKGGFKMLRGEAVRFGDRLILCGVDDPAGLWRGQPCNLDENAVLPPKGEARPVVLLKHQPRIVKESVGRFDVQLSGHTHGGQIFPWHVFSQASYGYNHGLFALAEGSWLYVSRGAGTWGPPLRLFAPPEVTLIVLKPRGGGAGR